MWRRVRVVPPAKRRAIAAVTPAPIAPLRHARRRCEISIAFLTARRCPCNPALVYRDFLHAAIGYSCCTLIHSVRPTSQCFLPVRACAKLPQWLAPLAAWAPCPSPDRPVRACWVATLTSESSPRDIGNQVRRTWRGGHNTTRAFAGTTRQPRARACVPRRCVLLFLCCRSRSRRPPITATPCRHAAAI